MKCKYCNNEMLEGQARARNFTFLTQTTTSMVFYPYDDEEKIVRKERINLSLNAKAYYCDTCMKVFAEFEEVRW